ncbi:MAG: hypothetical protein KBS85_05990, partial [Lachnospiraceae bacterium]|nr:hypothetical protein [Candidatus Merdinaster equi]
MKKILVFAMIAVMTISIAGCGKTTKTTDSVQVASTEDSNNSQTSVEEKNDSEVIEAASTSEETESSVEEKVEAKPQVELEYATLYDKYVGYTLTIGYPKDAGFTVEEKTSYGVAPKIEISDGVNSVRLNFYDYRNLSRKIEEAEGDGENVKQFTVGDMPGYVSMKEGDTSCLGYMTLVGEGYPDTGKNDTLSIGLSNKNRDADAFKEFFESDTLIAMLESITFKKSDTPDYPGCLTYDHLVGMNVDTAGAFEIEYDPYDTYLIKGHIKVNGKELGYVSATVDKNSSLSTEEALQKLQE